MRTFVYIGASLDGYIAKEDGDIEWLTQFQNDEVGNEYNEFIQQVDAIVIGRGTYEKVLTFPDWPYTIKAFILSNTLTELPTRLRDKASIVSMKPGSLLESLSRQGYSSIYVDGGKVIQSFLRDDLIDQMIITTVPLILGSGISLFGSANRLLLFRHVKTKVLSNGLVKSFYERKR